MAYFNTLNLLFIHIPKNAGKSIEVALGLGDTKHLPDVGKRSFLNRACTGLQRKTASPEAGSVLHGTLDVSLCAQHLTYQEIELLDLLPVKPDSLRRFAVCRNPWARALSTFRHFGPRKGSPQDFVNFCQDWYDLHSGDHNVLAHRRSQVDFVLDTRGRSAVDRVVRFENLADDFRELCREWELDVDELPHIGKQGSVAYQEMYTDESRKLVEKRFAEDIEFFGYRYE